MTSGKINIFGDNWIDIVFEGRNHAYGAYILRKKSEDYTIIGILFSVIFFTLIISTPVIVNFIEGLVPQNVKEIKDIEIVLAPPIDKPIPIELASTKTLPRLKPTIQFVLPVITPDALAKNDPIVPQDFLQGMEPGKITMEGGPNGIDSTLNDNGNGDVEETKPVLDYAAQMPEFEGGEDALKTFMKEKTNYPQHAKENQQEHKIFIQFVVGTDGKITDVKALTHYGWGLEEEAMRVVKLMPDWKPGKQNGKAVSVRFMVPFVFSLSGN